MGSKKPQRKNRQEITLEFIELRPMTQEEVDSLVQFYFELWRRRYERRQNSRNNTPGPETGDENHKENKDKQQEN